LKKKKFLTPQIAIDSLGVRHCCGFRNNHDISVYSKIKKTFTQINK